MIVTAELQNWDHFTTRGKTYVSGIITGDIHQRFADGSCVTTSSLISAEGNIVRTYSGSVYRLVGPPRSGDPLVIATSENAKNL